MACTVLTTADVAEGVFGQLSVLKLKSLIPVDGVSRLMREVSSDQIALTSAACSDELLQQLNVQLAQRQESQAEWMPLQSNSFSKFVVDQLGGQMASVWVDLLSEGLVVASRKEWERHFENRTSILEVLLALDWKPDSSEPLSPEQIDWQNVSEECPVLEPTQPRYPGEGLKSCLERAGDWLPSELNRSSSDYPAILAGFHQWYDALDYSHEFSQSVQFSGTHHAGDYWHAIMHRREGDYSNSKYWFGNVGSHPLDSVMEQYAGHLETSDSVRMTPWSHRSIVDFCSQAAPGSPEEAAARKYQAVEMVLLMKQTCEDARE